MNGTDVPEEPMDIPILSHFRLITGGDDDEAEALARDYGMQVDVVIGPSHPWIRFIPPLTKHALDLAALLADAARTVLRRRIDSSQAMEFVPCSYHIALRAEAVLCLVRLPRISSKWKMSDGLCNLPFKCKDPSLASMREPTSGTGTAMAQSLLLYGKGTGSVFARKECYRGDEGKECSRQGTLSANTTKVNTYTFYEIVKIKK